MSRFTQNRTRRTAGALILAGILALLLSGCSLSYILHAATGQIRIQHSAVPMERALRSDGLRPKEKERLRLVTRVKAFGESEIGLKRSDNYETVYLGDEPAPAYMVTAAHKTRLELVTWWFPVVGRMPYLGYFDPERARNKKRELEGEGLDAVIFPAGAYSTLGWFRDPVHRNLLARESADIVDTILHEMTHVTLYAKGQPAFNETLAMLVGMRGAVAFLERERGVDSPEARRARAALRDERRFSAFIDDLTSRLSELYDGPLSEEQKLLRRETVFAEGMERFRTLREGMETDQFASFGLEGLNNATLIAVALYHRHFNLFESVLKARGESLREALKVFRKLSEKDGDLVERTREWLS